MSIDTIILGVRDMDEKFKPMMALKNHCDELGVSYPKEVEEYFGDLVGEHENTLCEEMLEVDLDDLKDVMDGHPKFGNGVIIDLTKLPSDIKKIRVYTG